MHDLASIVTTFMRSKNNLRSFTRSWVWQRREFAYMRRKTGLRSRGNEFTFFSAKPERAEVTIASSRGGRYFLSLYVIDRVTETASSNPPILEGRLSEAAKASSKQVIVPWSRRLSGGTKEEACSASPSSYWFLLRLLILSQKKLGMPKELLERKSGFVSFFERFLYFVLSPGQLDFEPSHGVRREVGFQKGILLKNFARFNCVNDYMHLISMIETPA